MRNGHRNLWTAEEDHHLRELIARDASTTLMSAKLKRSAEAIRMRIIVLRKRDLPLPAPLSRGRAIDQEIGAVSSGAFRGQGKS
jgi:hypothetical protein